MSGNILPIAIGQAGNQILSEMVSIDRINNNKSSNFDNFLSEETGSYYCIDSEPKVIKIDNNVNNNKMKLTYQNCVTNNNGRGNNWALGYSTSYKEKNKENLCLESFDKLNSFIEKCDFIEGFGFIHSLNGGTGSGLSTRLIELIRDEFPKRLIIDFPVFGLSSK